MERSDQVKRALATVRVPLFLARESETGKDRRFTLHTADKASAAALRKQAETALSGQGIAADCKVVVHTQSALARNKSLEAFAASFGPGVTVFDPTGAVGRADALAACAAAIRASLDVRVQGVFADATRRTLFVVLDRARFSDKAETMLAERGEALAAIAGIVTAWRQRADSIEMAIRVGFELPAGGTLIPVDVKSERFARPGRSMFDRLRKPGMAATLASVLGLGTAAQAVAADVTLGSQVGTLSPGPAVAAPNLGLIAGGGTLTRNGTSQGWAGVGVEATIPLGESMGAQFDAAAGGDSYYGFGGHVFWRDPSRGMLGVAASTESFAGNSSLTRVAVEGALYKDKVTLSGSVGGQSGTTASGAFGSVDLTFYPTDNLALSAGGEFGSKSFGRASVEWAPAINGLPGLSLFADGTFGGSDTRVLAGVKYFFGTNGASIKDRDRRYDPKFSLFNTQNLGYNGYQAPIY